jgi:hypothetical protein
VNMTPTHAEKMGWSRMAQAAYAISRNDLGHRYSAAASLSTGAHMPLRMFDQLMADYRAWLIVNAYPPREAQS